MTTRKRHTPEQVVRKLTQADRLLSEGKDVADVCREMQVSEQTYCRWRNPFGRADTMWPRPRRLGVRCARRSGIEWWDRSAMRYRCRHGEGREEAPVEDRGPEAVGVAQRHRRATHISRSQRPDRKRREGDESAEAADPERPASGDRVATN